MKNLCGLSLTELEQIFPSHPRYRVKQIYKWIIKGISSFEQMTDIPNSMQTELKKDFKILSSEISSIHNDVNTQKTAVTLKDGSCVESVLLNDDKDRFTVCLSTQVGCPAGCVFCKTGSLGFKRNLDNTEIVEQFFHLKNLLEKISRRDEETKHTIDNIVIMGMGEPLLNLDNLRKAISIFTDPHGMNFSKRRITVSTCGIYAGLFDLAENGPFIRLALSLVTADETLRQKLMPITKTNPLKNVKDALIRFQKKSSSRITLEVPLLGGINTRNKDAVSIFEFSKGLDTVVNIIPWNPVTNLEFEGKPLYEPDKNEIQDFIKMLENQKLKVTKRLHKGRSVMGACGQLGSSLLHGF
ncbi:MAG: 23S rRNA (adenine(2503)-C(2))-methyltransferase RlmN [Treponema sp.]|nr:23S rRNA (adenine(2503)-C(2))-methyltransferase RlmN [Treponema sp.]